MARKLHTDNTYEERPYDRHEYAEAPNTRNGTEEAATPTVRERVLALLSIPVAAAAFIYVACGRGFVWDPIAYTIAWLTLIAALAYGIPMLDITIDTCAIIWRHAKRVIRRMRRALADGGARRDAAVSPRTARVVRGTASGEVRP